MSKGGYQELQSTHNWKSAIVVGVKTQEFNKRALRINEVKEQIHGTDKRIR